MASPRVFTQDFLIIAGLALIQIINAAYMVLLTPILNLGIKPLLLIIFGNLTTSFFVLPFAVVFEREKWPTKLTPALIIQVLCIAFGGVTTFQALLLQGLKKTSPAIASAMPNLAPGVIFIIAACFGFEKVSMKCKYSMTKILGTMACLSGAITMSFLQSPSASSLPSNENINQDWFIGCSCLLAAVLVVSCTTVLQAAVMIHIQAPFTLCAVTSSLGAVITAFVQIITGGNLDIGSPDISIWILIAVILMGGMLTASCLAFQTWCVMKKGPVLVSMFSPIQTVCSAVLASLLLGKFITWGSVGGMMVMFMGLYMVLWAKKKEDSLIYEADKENGRHATDDIEEPLLS
ncbi:WAT1-related protein At5g47470 [Dioscorea cayenensis subsp. rotundata]|uniref:WAT1-related protein At5g47470 n=1 Tax=Dioscorea cayennensis subsp. rotundata TaxID=55577 RepID=A0AB40CUU0_DIOCR|nr:WAT1-related protein At5g47470 [Dioscorea cayenensis subsp. rotundata]